VPFMRKWINIAKLDWPDDIVVYAHCMLDTYGYRHTLRICNTHCFSTATMVAQTRLSVTFYVH